MRGALLTKESDSSFAEAPRWFSSEPTHKEDEVEDQEDEVEDERDCEECKVESRREVRHTSAWHMDGMTRTNTLSQCHVRHCYECRETRENVTCERVLFTLLVGCSRLPSAVNDLATTFSKKYCELHQFSFHCHHDVLDKRRRRMPFLVLMKRDWFRSLFSKFAVETVHDCDCCSEVWSEFHRCISAWFVQWGIPVFLISLILLRGWAMGVVFLCQFFHLNALLLGPANFGLRTTKNWISLEAIVKSIKILFDTSLPRVVGEEMLFLCLSFALPSTTRTPLSDEVVRDWQSIRSPLVKMLAGFAFNQEMSTSALDYSLIPIKKAFWALQFWNCFA